jgi:selenide,water dikinase
MIGPMQTAKHRIEKDLVLLGGGHAHVQVVRSFGMTPERGIRVTLISPEPDTPYSGMLPGLVAGHYAYDETHIDLVRLCRWAGVRFLRAEAMGIDTLARNVTLKDRPAVGYDLLSVDTGSTPRADGVPGAAEFAIPVKPISRFLRHWSDLVVRANTHRGMYRVAVIGAGAGGVELLLAARQALQELPSLKTEFHLFSRGELLPAEAPSLRRHVGDLLRQIGINVHTNTKVTNVDRLGLTTGNGQHFELDEKLWVTAAGAPAWIRASGIATDAEGFLAVSPTLQSLSHPDIFAAGDVAAMLDNPRPKAGVFAVRQGPVLSRNLRKALRAQALETYRPQRSFLKILALGEKRGIASRGGWTVPGGWVWRWKDSIDRRFMSKFNDLPDMQSRPNIIARMQAAIAKPDDVDDMRCGGCGAKIGSDLLKRTLSGIPTVHREDILIGLEAPDDAAAFKLAVGKTLVQSVDSFRTMIDDPYVFGRIAANHGLGDIFAMGAEPHSALAIVSLPADSQAIMERDLRQIMHGAADVLREAGCALIGGHTAEGTELTLGFSLTGVTNENALLRKSGLQTGDVLILTKSLGTGALLAADMRAKARGRDVHEAIACMQQSSREAARILQAHRVCSCTDVTGFGLAAHLLEMLKASHASARIDLSAIPVLNGVLDAFQRGIFSTLHEENRKVENLITVMGSQKHSILEEILFDPQTAGGLLVGVPADQAMACLGELKAAGYSAASVIGQIVQAEEEPRIFLIEQKGNGGREWESNPPETLNAPHRF